VVTTAGGDYVLGTHDGEVARLGLQHRVWRETMLGAWRRAGLRPGWRVVDVGAGPGYATWDLAEIVGSSGQVLAVERSDHFSAVLDTEIRRRGLPQVESLKADLMVAAPPARYDMSWCRWVASFASSVPKLVDWIHGALRPGGTAVFHEYADYGSWRFAPARPRLTEFVEMVMTSWRTSGGEPDVAPALIGALGRSGFRLRSVRPLIFATRPGELTWEWPAAFIATNPARLVDLGLASRQWADEVQEEFRAMTADPASVMVTPLVLEVIAERP
jgi:SAM-dependent methyltransferase